MTLEYHFPYRHATTILLSPELNFWHLWFFPFLHPKYFFSDLILFVFTMCLEFVLFCFFYICPSYHFNYISPRHLLPRFSSALSLFCIILFSSKFWALSTSKVPCVIYFWSLVSRTVPSSQWIIKCISTFIFALLLTCLSLQMCDAPLPEGHIITLFCHSLTLLNKHIVPEKV